MWWRRKPKQAADPMERLESAAALNRARESMAEVITRNPGDDHLLYEYKKADPFGAQLFEAMKGKEV